MNESNFQIFQKFSWVRPSSKFSIGKTMKPTGDNKKIQQGELTNILRWLKNKYIGCETRLRNSRIANRFWKTAN